MSGFKLCIFGCILYIILNSFIFIIDALKGYGGSGKIFERFWLYTLILSSILVYVGTVGHFLKILLNTNKMISIVLGLIVASLEIAVLVFIFFAIAMFILAPILGYCGFYITMP